MTRGRELSEWHNGDLLIGDVLEKIKEIPDNSVDCCISSPPYWGLRDYGTGKWEGGKIPDCEHLAIRRKTRKERGGLSDVQAGNEGGFGDERQFSATLCPTCEAHYVDPQWGLERDFRDFLAKLQLLMTEIRRILKPTGTCFINLGDTYSGGYNHSDWDGSDERFDQRMKENQHQAQLKNQFKPKTRYGIPERFYINCIDDGWIARNHIIWAKSNAMPTSVKDRFQNKWESIFFFTKQQKYFFNLDAVREKPLSEGYRPFNRRVRDAKKLNQMGLDGAMTKAVASEEEIKEYGNHQPKGRSNFGSGKDIGKNMEKAREKLKEKYSDIGVQGQAKSLKERSAEARYAGADHDAALNDPKGKNPGDVFFINPKPFVEAHFATFPPELPEKLIRCGCPEKVCKKCGQPVENIMEPTPEYAKTLGKGWHDHGNDLEQGMQQKMEKRFSV